MSVATWPDTLKQYGGTILTGTSYTDAGAVDWISISGPPYDADGNATIYAWPDGGVDPDTGAPVHPDLYAIRQAWEKAVQADNGLPWFEDTTGGQWSMSAQAWKSLTAAQQQQVVTIATTPQSDGKVYTTWAQDALGEAWSQNYRSDQIVSYVRQRVAQAPALIKAAEDTYAAGDSFMVDLKTIAMLAGVLYGFGTAYTAIAGGVTSAADALSALSAANDEASLMNYSTEIATQTQTLTVAAGDAAAAQTAADIADAELGAAMQENAAASVTAEAAATASSAAADVTETKAAVKAAAATLTKTAEAAKSAADVAAGTGLSLADVGPWLKLAGGLAPAAIALYKASTGTTGVQYPVRNAAGQLINPATGQVIGYTDPTTGQLITSSGLSGGLTVGGITIPYWVLGVAALLLLRR